MIRDLAGEGNAFIDVDVLVVGAGTVGIPMAVKLSEAGLNVHCVEAGGIRQEEEAHPLNECEYGGTYYAGAAHGRFRCLGGTSTRWGGALIPFQSADLTSASWPLGTDELAPYIDAVEKMFGLPTGPYTAPAEPDDDFVARFAKWPPFPRRNTYNLFKARLHGAGTPTVWLNANLTSLRLENSRVTGLSAVAPDGSTLEIRAREIVIAGGAIETTRLLLLADRQNGGAISAVTPTLGEGFHDHLSAVVGELDVTRQTALNERIGFSFEAGGAMRNLRFELAAKAALRETVPPCFAHVGFEEGAGTGFDVLREIYRRLQQGRPPDFRTVAKLVAHAPWLTRAIWWRFVRKRLLFPERTRLNLHMVIQQAAIPANRISLSTSRFDSFGLPVSKIEWGVSDEDVRAMALATDRFLEWWAVSDLSMLAVVRRRDTPDIAKAMREGGGIYHPGGTTRMAENPASGVVDRDLRLFAAPNLRVVSTSVFPSGGGANPTMTLLLCAMRAADQIARAYRPVSTVVRS